MYQQVQSQEMRSSLLANLLHLVQSTFHNAKLYGFTYQGKDNSWSFGKDTNLIAGLMPVQEQDGPQFSDVTYKDKPFKVFVLPLKDGSFFFLLFRTKT